MSFDANCQINIIQRCSIIVTKPAIKKKLCILFSYIYHHSRIMTVKTCGVGLWVNCWCCNLQVSCCNACIPALHSLPHACKTINVEHGTLAKHHEPPRPPEPITAVRSRGANVTLSGTAQCGPEALGLHGRKDSKIEKYTVQELNTK